eukprot:12834815-Ditylum_brightwellii.AAC.1
MSHRDSRTSIDTQEKGRCSTQTGPQITNNTHNNMVLTKNGLRGQWGREQRQYPWIKRIKRIIDIFTAVMVIN